MGDDERQLTVDPELAVDLLLAAVKQALLAPTAEEKDKLLQSALNVLQAAETYGNG